MINFDASDLIQAVTNTINQIEGALDESALRKIGVAGAAIFRDEAKQNAASHIKTGTIYRSIIMKHLDEQSDGGKRQAYLVTVRKGRLKGDDAYYWRWVEKGHKFVPENKNISAKTGKKIRWKAHRRAAELEYGTASAPAYPFMRPAYESKKEAALETMKKMLAEALSGSATK